MDHHKRFIAREAYTRLDRFLDDQLPEMSRSKIQKLIKDNHVQINSQPVNRKNREIQPGDTVDLEIPQQEEIEYHPSLPLAPMKLYEDDYLLIIDKPAGISVHKGAGEQHETILDIFRYHYPQVNDIPDEERPGIVHRLDKETSGVLLLAKDVRTMRRLQKQFKRREVHKTYLALAAGKVRFRSGTIDAPIIRHPRHRTKYTVTDWDNPLSENAREAETRYAVIRQFDTFCYVQLMPLTGRTHQLRVHLAHLGNPVLGDTVYGRRFPFERMALHAHSIEFQHPITGNGIASFSPFPAIFREYIKMQYLPATETP